MPTKCSIAVVLHRRGESPNTPYGSGQVRGKYNDKHDAASVRL
ncbi:MAG: hypothetical protein QOF70_3883 [Acetobacteraceae bacterium]|jgi:hypothetical protein|nr:hypothetical protein [Acetobacteraceae bacterium]